MIKKISIIIVIIACVVVAFTSVKPKVVAPSYGETDAKVLIHESFDSISWYDIQSILHTLRLCGSRTIEINNLKWTEPNLFYDAILYESDPIIMKGSRGNYDLKKLKIWRKKHSGIAVEASFGEWVDFDSVVAVINILQADTGSINIPHSVVLSTYNKDKTSIYVDIHAIHHKKVNDPITSPALDGTKPQDVPINEVEAQSTQDHS